MLRKLILCCLLLSGEFAFAEYAKTPKEAIMKGVINGHIGAFFQQSSNQDPTYGDLNMDISYSTQRFMGYKIGAQAWLVPKLYQGKSGDFDNAQELFVFSQLYADFYNQYQKFGMTLGRYNIDEEWITHDTEGLSIRYDKIDNISLSFVWALRNAYVTNYYLSGFRKMFTWWGSLLFRADIQIPNTPIKVAPYLYIAPGVFISPGIKVDLHLPLKSGVYFNSKIQLLSYVADKSYYKDNSGSSGLVWAEGSVGWNKLETGVGLVSVGGNAGANRIDAFGQHTPFERAVGMFWANAVSIYGYGSAKIFQYADLYGAIRGTFINGKNILNWDARINFKPQKDIDLGIGMIGMFNHTDALDYFGGKDYLLFRGFIQYNF